MQDENNIPEMQQGIEEALTFSATGNNFQNWRYELVARINLLIREDFSQLIRMLYRLDVSESKIQVAIEHNPNVDAGSVIAELMINRQLEKIKTRQASRKADDSINEHDKW